MVTRGPKVISFLWNQFQTRGTITRKVNKGHYKASTFAKDRYLALISQQHRKTTVPHPAAVSGRRISRQTVYSRLSETSLYA
ncbi:hypothetical protein TNCV_2477711 [Trichonephila clavipes]|nr:hypothetical protein TNCV_2477711 [Trichonephila clavipes]